MLDTNVVSELMRPRPETDVVDWVDQQDPEHLHLSAVTVAELLYGVGRLASGRRRTTIANRVQAMLVEDFRRRILAFDETAAAHYAGIVVRRERSGRPISMADAQIAATCRSHQATLATRNVNDFIGIDIMVANPWGHAA